MSKGGFPQLQQQLANLNAAQRVGIAAAVALSSFAVYAAKNHRNICGGPLDSPRHRTNCLLNLLTCAPSNDINASIANIQDMVQDTFANAQERVQETFANVNDALNTIPHGARDVMADFDATAWDPAHWDLPAMPRMPPLPGFPRRLEPLLGCPHDEVLSNHPHPQTCLQCKELRRCSNVLERAYMDWTSSSPPEDESATPLLRCPHNQQIAPHATACMRCAERSYTNELERGRMSNWTVDHFAAGAAGEGYAGSPASMDSSGSMSSFQSMLSPQQLQQLPPQMATVAAEVSRSARDLVVDVQRNMGAGEDAAVTSNGRVLTSTSSRDGVTAARSLTGGKTAGYFCFWYLCTLCNDSFENPTFKLTTSISSITTGSLLTIAKALDYNYELPDVLALSIGASLSALRWAGAQYLLQSKIFKKDLYHEERLWIERKKTMNEETIGLYYIGFDLMIFLWQRYHEWTQHRATAVEGGMDNNNSGNVGTIEGGRRNSNVIKI